MCTRCAREMGRSTVRGVRLTFGAAHTLKVQYVTAEWGPGRLEGSDCGTENRAERSAALNTEKGVDRLHRTLLNDTAGQLQGCSSRHWILHLVVQCCIYIVHTVF